MSNAEFGYGTRGKKPESETFQFSGGMRAYTLDGMEAVCVSSTASRGIIP